MYSYTTVESVESQFSTNPPAYVDRYQRGPLCPQVLAQYEPAADGQDTIRNSEYHVYDGCKYCEH